MLHGVGVILSAVSGAENRKAQRGAGLSEGVRCFEQERPGYPAGLALSGRRAREVMPAAMRAASMRAGLVKFTFIAGGS